MVWHCVAVKTRAVLLAASLATGLLLATGPSAEAASWRHVDATGDASTTDFYGDNESDGPRPVASVRRGDLTRVAVSHTRTTLRITVGVRDMSPRDSELTIRIVTSKGDVFAVSHRRSFGWTGSTLLRYRGGSGSSFDCHGFEVTPVNGGIVATVPRPCVDNPYRVRAGVHTVDTATLHDDRGTVTRRINDDALRVGTATPIDRRVTLGPWVVGG